MNGAGALSVWVLVLVVVFIGWIPGKSQAQTLANCPGTDNSGTLEISATRSEKVYWTPPTASQPGYVVHGTHQPDRYYYTDTTVTYTLKNANVVIDTCTFVIKIRDNGSPVITSCPDDKTAVAPIGQTQVAVSWTAATVNDIARVQVSSTKSPNDLFNIGSTTVTYTFSFNDDNMAPSSFCSFNIIVQESDVSTVAAITCPPDQKVTLPSGEVSIPFTWDDPIYQEGLGQVTFHTGRQKNDDFYEGRNEISIVGYFESGEAKACSFTVNVEASEDTEHPSIIDCPSDFKEYVAMGVTGKIVTWPEPTIIDNTQQNLELQADHQNGIFYNVGSYDVTYTGSDGSENTDTCTFRVTIEVDETAPIIQGCTSSTQTYYVRAGETMSTITWEEPTATDNADQNVVLMGPTGNLANGGIMNVGETRTVTYQATDNFNNMQTCTYTIELLVDQVPQYTDCSLDMVFPVDSGLSYTNVTWPEPRVTDDRSADQLILTKSHEPGMNYGIGVYIISYTATDIIGNVGTCSFSITIEDQQNPVFTTCPASQSFTLGPTENSKDVMWTQPTVTDNSCAAFSNCSKALVVLSSVDPGLFQVGTEPVTITVRDPSGNEDSSCTFTITVNEYVPDETQPTWANCPNPAGGNTDLGLPTRTITWTVPVASDETGVVSQFASHTPPYDFGIGLVQEVRYEATDAAGNVGVCDFTVDVTDNENPVWQLDSGCGTSITHYVLSDRATIDITLPTPTATDNSGVTPTISNSKTDLRSYPFPPGTHTIAYTAQDNSGNSFGNCEITVNVMSVLNVNTWSVKASLDMSAIRGTRGQISSGSSALLLPELAVDMDMLMRQSTIGSHFVGIDSLTHVPTNGNTRVSFTLYFTKDFEGRHTTRQISEAFNNIVGSDYTFDTGNEVVPNTLVFNVREFKLTATLIALDVISNAAVFNSQFGQSTSEQFRGLADRVNVEMDKAYNEVFNYIIATTVAFESGSIVNEVILMFDENSGITESVIAQQFNDNLNGDGHLFASGLFYQAVPDTSVQELCPSGECQNGGTCSVDNSYTNVCTCPERYSGDNCETEAPTIVLSTAVIAAIIGGSILLLILLFAICCCCLYFCRDVGPYKDDRYPLERPFQIVDDKASVASSMDVFMMPRDRYYLEPPTPILALPPPQPPILSLPPAPPPEPPTLRLNDMDYGYDNAMYPMDMLPSDGPSFSPDGEVYVTGPNQVAIRPSTKRGHYYRY